MDSIKINRSERCPEVDFNFDGNEFALRGESYPEDITAFYGPVLEKFEEHITGLRDSQVRFDFELIYFNSSTAKVLMGLFDTLDEAASEGNDVLITWTCDVEDDAMEEMGEEFAEDLEHAKFELKKTQE